MDLSAINDMTQLKAMAYDQLALRDQAQQMLSAINNRIVELIQQRQGEMANSPKEQGQDQPSGEALANATVAKESEVNDEENVTA